MKRMKKLISIRSIPILALALLIVLGTALEAVPPTKVSGSGEWSANTSWNWVGTATLYIEGEPDPFNVQYSLVLPAGMVPNDEGVYQGTTTEQLFYEDGAPPVIRTEGDKVTLEPTETTGVYTLKVKSSIVTGNVNGVPIAGGRLRIQGTVKQWPSGSANADFTIQGTISY